MANKFVERTKTVSFSPFPYKLIVVVSNDVAQSITDRADRYNFDEPTDEMAACVYPLAGGYCFMFIPDDAKLGIVVHECSHVVWLLLQHCGVALDTEVVAYYTGFLSEKLWDYVQKTPKRKKKSSRQFVPHSQLTNSK